MSWLRLQSQSYHGQKLSSCPQYVIADDNDHGFQDNIVNRSLNQPPMPRQRSAWLAYRPGICPKCHGDRCTLPCH
ncbi:hypothetical protein VFPPC_15257 [Pochonia chlamydosporia 170]|uniref:Uncharacterized protein n=1 Tax=Pochonia chlamydosporia 170 TaxID=1380566 RepID=A0A179G5M5_METCM|nr:hypothetical protein VFPPC_15257 [Pochonia chlamydosporia 170]OAQ73126.1 hypothetical protein VFPPC_15257 [Pochonia chlamydosporia 170]